MFEVYSEMQGKAFQFTSEQERDEKARKLMVCGFERRNGVRVINPGQNTWRWINSSY